MWYFILGFMLGGALGIAAMCLFFIASKSNHEIEEMERRRIR
jgi:hypothetical protein